MNIFEKDPVNTGRQMNLDWARGLAVLFMVLIHAQEYFLLEHQKETGIGLFIDFLGGVPAAPVFMFLMGIGFVYSRKSQPMQMIQRGAMLLGAGYLLSFLRGSLPNALHFAMTQDSAYSTMAMNTFFYVDIFQFSGLAMMAFGLVKHFKFKTKGVLGLLGVCAGLNLILMNMGWLPQSPIVTGITGLLWGSGELSFFPFLTWIFYPLAGYLFGQLLIRTTDPKKFYRIAGSLSLLVLIQAVLSFQDPIWTALGDENAYDYYQHTLFGNVVFTAFVVAWLFILNEIVSGLPKAMTKTVSRWSQNVTPIYFIHWVILGWLVAMMGYNTLSLPYYFILTGLVFTISDGLSITYVQHQKNNRLSSKGV